MLSVIDVQNGTDKVVEVKEGLKVTHYLSERDKYKSEFGLWSKKTAQATLEMCRVVYEAKKELESQEFLRFCNDIGRSGEDATVRKYLRIGEKYDQFYQYAALLPNSWTSIYEITQLSADTFEALVKTNQSMANMTGDQIKLLLGKQTQAASKTCADQSVAASTGQVSVAEAKTSTPDKSSQDSQALPSSHSPTEIADDVAPWFNSSQSPAANVTQMEMGESLPDSLSKPVEVPNEEQSRDSSHVSEAQPTRPLLERVATASSVTVEVVAEETFVPYELAIRFNSKPSDAALDALVESIMKLKEKFGVNVEIVNQLDHAV
jgi:hypothetical protein